MPNTPATNGHVKGRAAPPRELFDYTFPLSHVTVQYGLLSQFTLGHIEMNVQKNFPPPPIPTFTYPTDDGSRTEPNPSDAAYQEALQQHKIDTMFKVIDGMIELGVEVEIDQARVDEFKRVMGLLGTPLNEISDKVVYVKHCCVVDASELMSLANRMKGVTEEAIQAKQATFPSAVPEAGDPPLPSAVVGPVV